MSILDDAREGMNPDIRPQDDLFGHVNGRWLEEAEIPSDRSSWGPFVQLADTAEEQVRADHRGPRRRVTRATRRAAIDEDARKIGDLYASFMDEEAIAAVGTTPVRPLIEAVAGLRDVRDLAAFLGEFERIGGHGLFGSYVNTDDRKSDRYLFNLVQGGLGLPDESYYREDKFAEVREEYVAYLTRLLELGEPRGRRGRGRDGAGDRHPAGRRALGACGDPRRPEDLQPAHDRRAAGRSARPSTGTRTSRNLGGSAGDDRGGPACGSRRTSRTCRRCSTRSRSRTGRRGC